VTCNGNCVDENEKNCVACGGYGHEDFEATVAELLGEEYGEYVGWVHSIFISRERNWSQIEWWEQPALWVSSYWYLIGDMCERYERWLERKKEKHGDGP